MLELDIRLCDVEVETMIKLALICALYLAILRIIIEILETGLYGGEPYRGPMLIALGVLLMLVARGKD